MLVKNIFVLLHVITAAAWFGLGLRLSGQGRKALELGGEAGKTLAEDGEHTVWQMTLFIILTLVFSLGAFIAGGHFEAYGPVYHTSLLLILVLVADQLFVIRPGWNSLRSALDGGEGSDAAESARKRVAMGTGVGHLLWLVLVILMLWSRFPVLT